ncbi:MAG: twin-arginine translocation signal domain-containing protein, partial [Gemmatimonadetes bacterium]|nr:twin-arginine translocation signal domain-containing protein [Gemmatimonadota bacterium]
MSDSKRYEELFERYQNGDIDRRTFLKALGIAALATGVVGGPLTRRAMAAVDQVRFDGWGGVVSEAFR